MVRKPPAFQFYAKDWLTGTVLLPAAARGLYITLLAYQWDAGGIPIDEKPLLSKITQCDDKELAELWCFICHKFVKGRDGLWRNPRLEWQRRDALKYRKSQSVRGKQGGRPKSGGFPPGFGNQKALAKPPLNSSSASSSAVQKSGARTRHVSDPWNQQQKMAEMRRLIAAGMPPDRAKTQVFGIRRSQWESDS